MYIYIIFPFEMRVASGDHRVVIFARIRIDNLPVHLGYEVQVMAEELTYTALLKRVIKMSTNTKSNLTLRNVQISD